MDDRMKAVLAHITPIGWIVSLLLNSKENGALTSFYLRQCLGLWCLGIVINFIFYLPLLGHFWFIFWIGMALLWIISLLNALGSKLAPLPFVGESFQNWFKAIGNSEKVS
jgi:hypothetical protein